MHAQDFYNISNDYISSPIENAPKLMISGYNKGPLRNSLLSGASKTRNDASKKLSLSMTNGTNEIKQPPKSGMSKNGMNYLTPQLSGRPSTSGNQSGSHRSRLAQAFRERVKS